MVTRLEMLVDRLDGQLSKRRKELTDIRLISVGGSGSSAATLRRAGHVMAYAHWEGFSKFAFNQYLEYLCQANLPVSSLKVQLRTLNYWDSFKSMVASSDFRSAVNFVESLAQVTATQFTIEPGEVTKTGNLDSKKFRLLLDLCALEYKSIYQTRENFIDQVLCGRRHRIAHGLLEPVSSADLIQAIDGAMELCEGVNEQIQEGLIYSHYENKVSGAVQVLV
jgi:MAE_28990/MAE_18760-like HEPN